MKYKLLGLTLALALTIGTASVVFAKIATDNGPSNIEDVAEEVDKVATDVVGNATTTNSQTAPNVEENGFTRKFMQTDGKISTINSSEKIKSIAVETNPEAGPLEGRVIYHITEETTIIDAKTQKVKTFKDLKKDASVTVINRTNIPVTMSLPPQMQAFAVIINNESVSVKVDSFDENHLSSDNGLKLNLSDKSDIVDLKGEKVAVEDIKGAELAVFYKMSTKSLPPQTSPTKVVVLELADTTGTTEPAETVTPAPGTGTDEPSIQPIVTAESIIQLLKVNEPNVVKEVNGKTFIPIARVARELGYDVSWLDETKTLEISKANMTNYTITIGKVEYGYLRSIRSFSEAPVIIDSVAYVEEDFFSGFDK